MRILEHILVVIPLDELEMPDGGVDDRVQKNQDEADAYRNSSDGRQLYAGSRADRDCAPRIGAHASWPDYGRGHSLLSPPWFHSLHSKAGLVTETPRFPGP